MPWKRAKALPPPDNTLFEACFRIQREANAVADHYIPLVVENVCGAQKWVGRARWHFGSFYLWGDVPALMPIVKKHVKVPTMGAGWYPQDHPKHVAGLAFNGHAEKSWAEGQKNPGFRFDGSGRSFQTASVEGVKMASEAGRRTDVGKGARFTSRDCGDEGVNQHGSGREWFAGEGKISRVSGSRSPARKAASAQIAKIPLVLAAWIGKAWYPVDSAGREA
jgi:hypothetical protein